MVRDRGVERMDLGAFYRAYRAYGHGRARIVGEVERLERDGAILIGGDRSPADDVILATGYRRGLERLVAHLGSLDERGTPRYADGAPADPETPGLYFAGFRVALSGSIRIAASMLAESLRRSLAKHKQGRSHTELRLWDAELVRALLPLRRANPAVVADVGSALALEQWQQRG